MPLVYNHSESSKCASGISDKLAAIRSLHSTTLLVYFYLLHPFKNYFLCFLFLLLDLYALQLYDYYVLLCSLVAG